MEEGHLHFSIFLKKQRFVSMTYRHPVSSVCSLRLDLPPTMNP